MSKRPERFIEPWLAYWRQQHGLTEADIATKHPWDVVDLPDWAKQPIVIDRETLERFREEVEATMDPANWV